MRHATSAIPVVGGGVWAKRRTHLASVALLVWGGASGRLGRELRLALGAVRVGAARLAGRVVTGPCAR
ncbi:hypothetical protein FRACA_770008 [Frankia canadensis]|uniref:Uncharacterized protein n=1 Tax=Frankia canadensis TaxID=1836972 RepID=A0A2I2L145_9ACTN|nr:hypothetical protein FRACA_770008 [Frankia canadensis]SOU58915.1 hypothetical protein FRACA_770008 [Frankia canadensis]